MLRTEGAYEKFSYDKIRKLLVFFGSSVKNG